MEQTDSHINSNIQGLSATTQSLQNVNTSISRPSAPKPIQAPCHKFLTRPPEQIPICATTAQTTTNLNQILAHLTAINQVQITMLVEHQVPVHEDQLQESSPGSPATSTAASSKTEETSLDITTADETLSTRSNNSTTSTTASDRYPISYDEKLLTKLHRIPQMRTFSNISIPLPTTNTESKEDYNEHLDNT